MSMLSGVPDGIALNDRSNALVSVVLDLTPNPPEFPGSKAFECKVSTSESVLGDGVSELAALISELSESLKTGSPSIRNTIPATRNRMMSDRDF